MIDQFTRKQFEATLPVNKDTGKPLWKCAGLIGGEYVYYIPVNGTNKRIVIRSSVDQSGIAADAGQDSIRLWVEYYYPKAKEWFVLARLDRWTTRVSGWEQRMAEKLRELWKLALADSHYNRTVKADESNEKKANEKAPDSSALTGEAGSPPTHSPESKQAPASPFQLGNEHKADTTDDELPQLVVGPEPEPNEQQRTAIEAPVNAAVRVPAGPGAGKTFVVAHRYAYLLAHGAGPSDIVAVTFSKTTADELLAQIVRINPQAVGTAAEQQACTIHALCYRLLRAEGDKRQVAKEWQVKRALQDIIEALWPYADDRPGYKEVLAFINHAKLSGLTSADDMQVFGGVRDKFGRNVGHELHESRKRLDDRLKRDNLLTFPDMLLDVEIKLQTDRAFREKWQARFKWLIIDESQDTTAQAMRILTTLAEPQKQVFLVGDTDQLLYRFTGATPEANLYNGFESRYPDGLLVKLETNYRSTQTIVDTQLRLIVNNYSDAGGPYDQKYLKMLVPRPDAPEGEAVTFNEYDSPELEAMALASSLIEELSNGQKPGDFFIGARTRAQLGYLEGPLTRAKIPFINITGGSFWASKHVADVIGYLRLAFDESDDEAFARVFNIGSKWNVHPWGESKGEYCQHRYLGRAFLDACNKSYRGVWQAVNRKRSFGPGVEDLTGLMQEIQAEMAAAETPGSVIEFIVENCYRRYLAAEEGITADDEAENGKLEDLLTVADVADRFDDVKSFLGYVAEMVQAAEDAKNKDWSDYVVLSTVHRLKGLERDIVYGVGLSEGFMDTTGPVPIPAGLLPHTFSMTSPPNNGVLPTGGQGRIEDERCIAFVLVSRARERVHLSSVKKYRKSTLHASRFVEEMGIGGNNAQPGS